MQAFYSNEYMRNRSYRPPTAFFHTCHAVRTRLCRCACGTTCLTRFMQLLGDSSSFDDKRLVRYYDLVHRLLTR